MRWAKEAGILIGVGTDTAGTLSDEIAMVAKTLGENPVEAIGRATSINAKIVNQPDMGLLEPGKLANIAVFRGDLTKELTGLKKVTDTWKDGVKIKGAIGD